MDEDLCARSKDCFTNCFPSSLYKREPNACWQQPFSKTGNAFVNASVRQFGDAWAQSFLWARLFAASSVVDRGSSFALFCWLTHNNGVAKRFHHSPIKPPPDDAPPCNESITSSTLHEWKVFWKVLRFTARNTCLKMEDQFVRYI